MQKRKRGRPSKDSRIDTSNLLNGVWILLDIINRYRTIAFDVGRTPNTEFSEPLMEFEKLIQNYLLKVSSGLPQAPSNKDLALRLNIADRYKKAVTIIYKKCKRTKEAEPLNRTECEREIRELFSKKKLYISLEEIVRTLSLTDRQIKELSMRGNFSPSELASNNLGKLFDLGSRKTQKSKRDSLASPELPVQFEPDIFCLDAMKQLLIVSGYSKKTAEKVVQILEKDSESACSTLPALSQEEKDRILTPPQYLASDEQIKYGKMQTSEVEECLY